MHAGSAAEERHTADASEALPELDPDDAVSVAPILGIETDESELSGRPRFKTLMGVPRSDPDLDELAGFDINSGRHDTVRLDRSRLQAATQGADDPEAESRESNGAHSLAGTSWPWDRSSAGPAPSSRVAPSLALQAESSLDVAAEVAALRTSPRRRPWLAGLGVLAAAVAALSIAAPRERTLALRWLQREYRARVQSAGAATSDRAALRPSANAAALAAARLERTTAERDTVVAAPRANYDQPQLEQGSGSMGAPVVVARPGGTELETMARHASPRQPLGKSAPNQPDDAAAGAVAENAPPRETAPPQAPPDRAAPDAHSEPRVSASVSQSEKATRDARTTSAPRKAHTQVAAPRKPPPRAATAPNRATKARATPQNSPRKDSGGGIIRETPF